MIVEKRGLIYVGKRYCELLSLLEEKNIPFLEYLDTREIVIDLKDGVSIDSLTILYLNEFILYQEKEIVKQIDKLVFWR